MNNHSVWVIDSSVNNWVNMVDDAGNKLPGIRGFSGPYCLVDGNVMGGDVVKMDAGAVYPLHIHEGGHIIYVLSGRGRVDTPNGPRPIETDCMIAIPPGAPHGIAAETDLVFVVVGYPHNAVGSSDRMVRVEEN